MTVVEFLINALMGVGTGVTANFATDLLKNHLSKDKVEELEKLVNENKKEELEKELKIAMKYNEALKNEIEKLKDKEKNTYTINNDLKGAKNPILHQGSGDINIGK